MKKALLSFSLLCLAFTLLLGQKSKTNIPNSKEINVLMQAENWKFQAGKVEFTTHRSVPAIKILPDAGKVVLKNQIFTTGTIEFDVEITEYPFAGVSFRRQNAMEEEWFYLRTARAGNLMAMDAIQYAPIIKGVTLWDMLGQYQAPANIKTKEWNHIKLVISEHQMLVYVNNLERPALEIPNLEGNTKSGQIAFDGVATFANLIIKPNITENLTDTPGSDITQHDPRYMRQWAVSQPVVFPFGRDVNNIDLPNDTTKWANITAERQGLINLTRLYGGSQNGERRLVWLKTTIQSAEPQRRRLDFGFSDEVWVVINGQLLYIDKNYYGSPIMKEPDGRISIENTSFELPLKAGENQLLIGVANNFYGWGIIARLDRVEGITLTK